MKIVYDQDYLSTGWCGDSAGLPPPSWFDHDLTTTSGVLIKLNMLQQTTLFSDPDVIFVPPPITVEVFASFFDDDDLIFTPSSARITKAPDQMLKNEVRRVR